MTRWIVLLLIFAVFLSNSALVFAEGDDFGGNDCGLYSINIKEGCPMPSASASYLCEWKSGAALHSHNGDVKLPMASTTKIMTAILVAELLPLDREVTVTAESAGTEGSSIYLYEGEVITVRTLLYALMLESANDAATALAIEAAGSVENFASLMNRKAAELGLSKTHFTNPHGLDDPNHYTTASELAKIAAYALGNPIVAEVMATKTYKADSRVMTNHNRLLFTYNGAVGVKTGYTIATGRCLVTAATRDGMTLIAVTLNCRNDWQAHKNLLDWGFSNYKRVMLAKKGKHEYTLDVTGGNLSYVAVTNQTELDFFTDLADGEITFEVKVKRLPFAPVAVGQKLGEVNYYCNGEYIASLDLTAKASVEAVEEPIGFWQRFINWLKSLCPTKNTG